VTIASDADLDGMKAVGRLVGLTLETMAAAARPGMTTAELDAVAADFLRARGARSAPQLAYGFPGFTCISVNEEIVHGVPGSRRLAPGDVVKLDVTAELNGYIADAAVTVVLPPAAPAAEQLAVCARDAFACALRAARAGRPLSGIGRAVAAEVRRQGFNVLAELSGHGVGRAVHEKPDVPNVEVPALRQPLRAGMVLAVEPIISAVRARVLQESDGWTLRTDNRCLAAHYEHTIMVTDGEPLVLTAT
jgi:methionyl aminopeptidase